MLHEIRLFLRRLERRILLLIVKIFRLFKFLILTGTKLAIVVILGYLLISLVASGALGNFISGLDGPESTPTISIDDDPLDREAPNDGPIDREVPDKEKKETEPISGKNINLDAESKRVGGSSYDAEEIEEELREKVMEYRKSNSLKTLRKSKKLKMNSRRYSTDMAKRNFYSPRHVNPDGEGVKERIVMRFSFCDFGSENAHKVPLNTKVKFQDVGKIDTIDSQGELVDIIFEGWKASPGHRRNMLRSNVDVSGMGVYIDKSSSTAYATHQMCSI